MSPISTTHTSYTSYTLYAICTILTICSAYLVQNIHLYTTFSNIYHFMHNMIDQNMYVGVFIISQIYQYIVPTILNWINFAINSTFITWYAISTDNSTMWYDDNSLSTSTWFMHYLAKKYESNKVHSLSCKIESSSSARQIWFDKSKSDILPQIRYVPGTTYNMMIFRSRPIFINIASSSSIMLYSLCWPWNRTSIFKELFKEVRDVYRSDIEFNQQIYKIDSASYNNIGFNKPQLVPKIKISDGVYELTDDMIQIVDHVKNFLTDSNKQFCSDHGLSYCSRIYAHGPPGTGKTHLATRIAGEFNLPMYQLNCENMTDCILEQIFDNIQRGIIVIDEIDNYVYEALQMNMILNDDTKTKIRSVPTISGWHRVLDKIMGNQVIVYLTTNNNHTITELNYGSLIRPERIDLNVHVGYIKPDFVHKLLEMYDAPIELDLYTDENGKTLLTPADIISCIKIGRSDLSKTLEQIKKIDDRISALSKKIEKSRLLNIRKL